MAVITDADGAFWPRAAVTRLEALFGDISCALEEGRLDAALRLTDRACRIFPQDPTCLLLHARLLMRRGAASDVAERLRGRHEPEAIAICAEALCVQGFWDAAAASCEMLLGRFALDAVESLPQLATRLCRATEFPGWVGVDSKLRVVGRVRKGNQVRIIGAERTWSPTVVAVDQDGLDVWHFEVPAGFSGQLSVRTGDLTLLGSSLSWPPEFGPSGWVVMENNELRGEVQLDWAPGLPVAVAIGSSGNEPMRLLLPPSAASGSRFLVPLDRLKRHTSPLEVSAVLPDGTSSALTGSPVDMELPSPTPVRGFLRRTVPPIAENGPISKEKVDIVVPVYAGRDETLRCIERVLATVTRSEAEVVVVNDASPDFDLRAALAGLADDGLITLLTNESNLGFPGAANRGMNLHNDRDIVLLNSDTELFGGWLKRLKCAAYSAHDIATVTPLGEVASITSYPGKAERSYTTEAAQEIDRIASEVNPGKIVELPVGVGFCLYIKRACLNEIGEFDEITFGKGYGEENDFCLRARGRGWRHVAATDLFVRHEGARSYGSKKRALTERNRHVLSALYPDYDAMISEFIAADPLLDARRAIDIHRLLRIANDPVLLVTFGLPGGVKRHVDERQSVLSSAGHTVVVLQPGPSGRMDQVVLQVQSEGMENLAFNLPEELPMLRALLLDLRILCIELHHFAGLPAVALEAVADLGIPYDVYVHDYSWICPRLALVGENGGYCGEPPIEQCEACIRKLGTALEESLTVEALRSRSSRILAGARTVIVPSMDVRTRLARYFPTLAVQVMGWEKPIELIARRSTAPNGRVHVAVIGAISIPKGHQILLECAREAAARGLDLDFVVIGFTEDDDALLKTGRVFVTGPYADSEVSALLEREQAQVAFFPSIVPETWSYALSHALNRSLPIVAFDLGAIAERLRMYAAAELLPLSTAAGAINDALLRSGRRIDTSNAQYLRSLP